MTERRIFLDVTASARGLIWRDRLDAAGQARALAIVQQHGAPDLLARVLAGRGVAPQEVAAFLEPTVRALMPDPAGLAGMEEASERLAAAAVRGERVAIFGDYDVDGACSTALLADFLEAAGATTVIHIPDRIYEGYGPNIEAIEKLAEQGARLLVTVDCGVTSHEPLARAGALGLDVVVLDHHQAPERLPAARAIVDPNRQDDLSGMGHLCAAGVVFLTLVDVARRLRGRGWWTAGRPEPKLIEALDLVALATVADVVPLVGLNRAFVLRGCELMKARARPGLAALFDAARVGGPPRPFHLGYLVGPRINAGGRIGDASLGARLLRERDPVLARDIAERLDRLNAERQTIEAATVEEAEAEALAALGLGEKGAAVLVSGDNWHPGVVGLVASRLKERFRRPAFAIALSGATGTGSARSIPGVDLGRAVRAAVEAGLLVKGGGHAMAAGLTIRREQLGAFRAFLEERLASQVANARAADGLDIDAALTAGGARVELAQQIERAGPFGAGNPDPVFVLPRHRIREVAEVGEQHLRVTAEAGDGAVLRAMAFRAQGGDLGAFLTARRGGLAHLAGHLSIDRFRGEERAQFRLIDAADPARD